MSTTTINASTKEVTKTLNFVMFNGTVHSIPDNISKIEFIKSLRSGQ